MLYAREFVSQKPQRGLQLFEASLVSSNSGRSNEKYRQVLKRFTCTVPIHGLPYLLTLPMWVRCFWITVVISAFASSVAMYVQITRRHNNQQLKTMVETSQYPTYNIKFPAVAVCPSNSVNWVRHDVAEKRFMPRNASQEALVAFHNLLLTLEQLDCYSFDQLSYVVARRQALPLLRDVSVSELGRFVAFRCDELFVDCIFDETAYDCCKLFVAEPTEKGICMVFNSLITEESRNKQLTDTSYPWTLSKAGERSGLRFTIRYNSSYYRRNLSDFTMNLMVKETAQWSESIIYPLYENTKNYVSITPTFTEAANNTREVPPAKRHCLFSDESRLHYGDIEEFSYNRQNCFASCLQHHLKRVCNCTFSLFFPTKNQTSRECTSMDFPCLFDNRDIFSYIKDPSQDAYIKDTRRGLTCDCMDNCYSLVYLLSLNTVKLSNLTNKNATTSLIKADIHYGQRVMIKYQTKLEYTTIDLMASFGGTFALFLGASVLNLAEMLQLIMQLSRMAIGDCLYFWRQRRRRGADRTAI